MMVSISEAARMVGIKSRSTMYRHIKNKNISVTEDDSGNPVIDVSELVRVYGDKVKVKEDRSDKTSEITQPVQVNTGTTDNLELGVLKERLKNLESAREIQEAERRKERELLLDQIENLRKTVDEAQGQSKRLTALITDQSGNQQQKEVDRDSKIQSLEKMIREMKAQNDDLIAKEKMRSKRQEERRAQREKEKQLEMERQIAEQNKSVWQKLFG